MSTPYYRLSSIESSHSRLLGVLFACLQSSSAIMATFLSLPPEIHYGIGEHCEKNCLISLCRTSKWLNQSYVPILYRHVNLRLEFMADREYLRSNYEGKRQMQFIHTLLNHPEYGSYIRSFKGLFCVFSRHESSGNHHIRNPDEGLWRAMKLLTHVQSVDVGSRSHYTDIMMRSNRLFPTGLFRSATSVTLRGSMPYKLAKSIIDAINPARLEYLCLDKVQECGLIKIHYLYRPGEKDENGRIVAYGATTGLLTSLTGKCTALRTLILRRIGQRIQGHGWHAPAEEASYKEWASFISSVKGTLEKLTFQQEE